MWGRLKTLVLAAVVASAALVPLFGDPRTTPVTHPLWARMLLRSMDMNDAVRTSTQASQAFGALAWRDSLALPADQFLEADGAVVGVENGETVVTASAGPAELVYPVAVVQPGDYQFRARLSGSADNPASAELAPLRGGSTVKTFTLVPDAARWSFGGSAHLDPGAYGASVLLPPGCSLSQVEVAPPCLNPIEPEGGWEPRGEITARDLSITGLKTMDMEHELPPADTPIEIAAGDFQVEAPAEIVEARAAAGADAAAPRALRGGSKGLRAIVSVEIPEAGLYSISGFVNPGSGQRWLVDGCRKAVVCPGEGSGWRPIMTQSFSAGRHTLMVSLGNAATLDLVRIEKKKNGPEDYEATMRRLGFDPGAEGPVTRDTAISAMDFIADKRQEQMAIMCGDSIVVDETPLPPPLMADLPAPTDPVAPAPPGVPPIGAPILPPQAPASPTSPTEG
jgi:hypothetical protein